MKKISFIICSISIIPAMVFAQTIDDSMNPDKNILLALNSPSPVSVVSTLKPDPRLPDNIHLNAARHFQKNHMQASDVRWTVFPDCFRVYFTWDSIQHRIFYTRHGYVKMMFRYYTENKLPPGIRHLIGSHYYDFSIFTVTEVTTIKK
mgnify:CR=1 FL=1